MEEYMRKASGPNGPVELGGIEKHRISSHGLEVTYGDITSIPEKPLPDLHVNRHPKGGPLNVATLKQKATPRSVEAVERAIQCARVADDNKAKDVVILDMRGLTPIYDFLVLATGTSRRQIHTLAEEIDAAMNELKEKRLSIEGYQASKWVVQDYGDVVVHVFDPDTREYYAIEDLWADAPKLDWQR